MVHIGTVCQTVDLKRGEAALSFSLSELNEDAAAESHRGWSSWGHQEGIFFSVPPWAECRMMMFLVVAEWDTNWGERVAPINMTHIENQIFALHSISRFLPPRNKHNTKDKTVTIVMKIFHNWKESTARHQCQKSRKALEMLLLHPRCTWQVQFRQLDMEIRI